MKKSTILVLLFFLSSFTCTIAQENISTIIKKYTASLGNTQKVDIVYKIYKGHSSSIAEEIKRGFFCKDGDKLYTKIGDVEIINLPDIHLKINHTEQAILVANGMVAPTNVNFNLEEFSKYLTTELIGSTSKNLTLIFTPNENITQVPFEKLIVTLDKRSYQLKKQVFYYRTKMNFSNNLKGDDVKKVKLEVIFSNYRNLNKNDLKVFDTKKYILTQNNKVLPSNVYKGYDIVNIRS